MKSKAVVVTGTSSGIGASTAEYFAGKGYHVFGSVRRAADGERLQSRLGAAPPKTRYAPVHGRFLNWTLPGVLPKRFVDRKIGRALGLLE